MAAHLLKHDGRQIKCDRKPAQTQLGEKTRLKFYENKGEENFKCDWTLVKTQLKKGQNTLQGLTKHD